MRTTRTSNAVSGRLGAREGVVTAPAERGARKGGDAMNARETKTNPRSKRRRGLVALLLTTALLAAGGPTSSLASGPELQLACQGTSCGG
jgi:hypothetical protein